MEIHSLPEDCYIEGISEGMLWMVSKGCPQLKAEQTIDEDSSDRTLCESIDWPEAFS